MGIIYSRLKKKKSTLEVLETLEKEIRAIEESHRSTEQQHKKVMGHLMLYAVGLYVLVAFFFYFFFFPATLHEQILYLLPLLIMPILFVFVRRVVTWHYRRKLTHNEGKLTKMKTQKKQLLEEVMDKETYKVAKQILEKFAPDQLKKVTGPTPVVPPVRMSTENMVVLASKPGMVPTVSPHGPNLHPNSELRWRSFGNSPTAPMPLQVSPIKRTPANSPPVGARESSPPDSAKPAVPVSAASVSSSSSAGASCSTVDPVAEDVVPVAGAGHVDGESPVALRLPRPILPQDRTVMDRLVDYLIGEGPSNRYALICQKCASHNGMAMKEEFEYFAFRCCYCYHYNPARKQKPQAPRLEAPSSQSTSTSEAESPPTTSEEEEDATKPEDPARVVPNERRESTHSVRGGEGDRSSHRTTGATKPPSESSPTPANPFESSDEEQEGDSDTLTSPPTQLSPGTEILSPPGEGVSVSPAATSTPTGEKSV